MNIQKMNYQLEVENEIYRGELDIKSGNTLCASDAVKISAISNGNIINLAAVNESGQTIRLQKLKLELITTKNYKGLAAIFNSENPVEKLTLNNFSKFIYGNIYLSHMYEVFIDKENNCTKIFGFLSSHTSRNYIECKLTGNNLNVYAVYDFINHDLKEGEEMLLSPLYINTGSNIFSDVNSYIDNIAAGGAGTQGKNAANKLNIVEKNILFSPTVTSNTIKVNGKAQSVKIDGKRLYPIDITIASVKEYIIEMLEKENCIDIMINNIDKYIDFIVKKKLFNVYNELNQLFVKVKEQLGKRIFSEDCPLGLAVNNINILDKKFNYNRVGLLNKFPVGSKADEVNYNFFVKLILRRIGVRYMSVPDISDKIQRQLMTIVFGNATKDTINHHILKGIIDDMDINKGIIPYVKSENVFSFLFTGKENIYIALFNLSNRSQKFYCDFSAYGGPGEIDGVASELFTENSYFVIDGKVYLRELPSMECRLFMKPLNSVNNLQKNAI